MESLSGSVAIVTGAGGGLGRQHALTLASLGARVVVNDVGGSLTGHGHDTTAAEAVVSEITAAGGEAVADRNSVSDFAAAGRLVGTALDTFGRLDVLVNNAGILRDRMLVNMSVEDFDAVIDVHLRGTFCTTRHAAAHWRALAKAGGPVQASVVNTTSGSGLFNNVGQANYAAAKAAVATFSQVAAKELGRYGVRVNTIAPLARTRLVDHTPALQELAGPPGQDGFDPWDPAHVSTLVACLASPACRVTGGIWQVFGGRIDLVTGYRPDRRVERVGPWTVDELAPELERLAATDELPGELPSEAADAWQVIDDAVVAQTARGKEDTK